MFADAAREVRHHPGRIVATLVAIAISVAFMAGVSIFMATQTKALGRSMALVTSQSDAVASINTAKTGVDDAKVLAALKAVPGVKAVEPAASGMGSLSTDEKQVYASLYAVPGEDFRWANLTEGAWASKPSEITLSGQLADKLQVGVGDSVTNGNEQLTVVGITDDPSTLFFQTAYQTPSALKGEGPAPLWLMDLADGADQAAVIAQARQALVPMVDQPDARGPYTDERNLEVSSSEDSQATAVSEITGDFDVMKYALLIFSGVAALVGLITISNTFTILLAQRRRQIGLLRAVGATGAQVRRRFLAEAVLLGMIGSALGLLLGTLLAWVGARYTRADYWGMSFPLGELALEFGLGVLLTVLAAMLPALKATRVAPLEALQPVATSEEVKRTSIVRAVLCGLLVLAGAFLAWRAVTMPVGDEPQVNGPVLNAVAGALLLTIGVLFAAPLYIPWVLRALGAVFGLAGPSARLAGTNAARNPRRAAATATALMLACGLIVTLQVGTATAERTVLQEVNSRYPVDLQVSSMGNFTAQDPQEAQDTSLSPKVVDSLKDLPNIARSTFMVGGRAQDSRGLPVTVVALTSQASTVSRDTLPALTDGQVVADAKPGTTMVLTGSSGQKLTLTVVEGAKKLGGNQAFVTDATMRKLVDKPTTQLYWGQLADRDEMGSSMAPLERLASANPGVMPSGSVTEAYMVTKVLDMLLLVTSALLGVAVLIALVGVSNTLGLSVIERTRESALLRALGMQKQGLRTMLLVEALMLGLAGVLVGVAAGAFFGWLGMKSLLRQAGLDAGILFAVDWKWTLGLIAIAVASAALASILPGRRAASATPTEALAQD
ncbi:FtsX-like permease family protein [Luteococcus sp. Sow4_B9]|uniref:FtsX-like permease family protein n=1 Tax=Luteococcus sp. Sow4_B9 TaxID=3438792 RepID=UPI003F97086B